MLTSTPDARSLNSVLRLLAKHRCQLIQEAIVREYGVKVQSGPFAGMEFVEQSAEGCHIPKLLGCYEEELHDVLRQLVEARYDVIINIGCAEGYYAVGMKRLCPQARVLAYDTNPAAQKACGDVATRNGVEIEVGGEFHPALFARFQKQKVLIWCDIEGAEVDLLDPKAAPALRNMDLVVELHPHSRGHAAKVIPERFADSHDVEVRTIRGHDPNLPPLLRKLGHLDQLLAQWEWRSTPTPWAVMKSRLPDQR